MLTTTEARRAVSEAPKPRRLSLINTATLQVASHPQSPAFSAPSHSEHHHSPPQYRDDALTGTPGALSFRRTLARPSTLHRHRARRPPRHGPRAVRRPCRVHSPLPARKGPAMLAGITSRSPPARPPPRHAHRPLRTPGAAPVSYPMHAIFPVHAVVLAAHCAKLPRLSPSVPAGSSRTASATLHVLPLTLPSPHAFAILHAFTYTHRLAPALAALLTLPAFLASFSYHGRSGEELTHPTLLATLASPPALHALAAHLCAASSSDLAALIRHAGHVKELWQDMVPLGVSDPELWDALDLAWEVVLGVLNLAAQ
ncbi:hypothetical protein DFH09DRAFT_467038 [Mycena vulgaris]|nr:hypothetical protein DFH09DRAFT_467038 [Mycena vulgaris]